MVGSNDKYVAHTLHSIYIAADTNTQTPHTSYHVVSANLNNTVERKKLLAHSTAERQQYIYPCRNIALQRASAQFRHYSALINYKMPIYARRLEPGLALVAWIFMLRARPPVCSHARSQCKHSSAHGFSFHCIFHCFSILHWLDQFIHHTSRTCPMSFRTMYANFIHTEMLSAHTASLLQRIHAYFSLALLVFFFFFHFGWRDICNNWFTQTQRTSRCELANRGTMNEWVCKMHTQETLRLGRARVCVWCGYEERSLEESVSTSSENASLSEI